MTEHAYAKVNLTLDILGKRQDGYHELSSVMQEISLYDTVQVLTSSSVGQGSVLLRLGKVRNLPTDDHNTCVKAAKVFLQHVGMTNVDVDIYLEKRLPLSSGIGAGSSDAAAVLRLLNASLKTCLSEEKLEKIAVRIGADVPFFIRGGTQIASGIGERLTPLAMDRKELYVLAVPDIPVSTPQIFAAYDELSETGAPTTVAFAEKVKDGKDPYGCLGNMLMPATAGQVPEVKELLELFKKMNVSAGMSGSGPAVFGVFKSYMKAQKAVQEILASGLASYAKICLPMATRK